MLNAYERSFLATLDAKRHSYLQTEKRCQLATFTSPKIAVLQFPSAMF